MPWESDSIKKTYSVKSLNTMTTDVKTPTVKSKICDHCGYDFADFMKTGFLGCSHCYQAFKKELEGYLDEFR